MNLPEKEKNYYKKLEKGFQGELLFDRWLEGILDHYIILSDLLLKANNKIFQIDTLIQAKNKLYLYNVKNHEGDFYIKDNKWYTTSNFEIDDPFPQLERSDYLLRRLLQELGYTFPIQSSLVFVNPEFSLYQAPLNRNIILPTQLPRLIRNLNKETSRLSDYHHKLCQHLVSLHIQPSPYAILPEYHYDQLKKGILCASCLSLCPVIQNNRIVCTGCGHKEDVSSAILRSIEEFRLLFPNRKITTIAIQEWCGIIHSNKTIWSVLTKYYKQEGKGKATYYCTKQ